MYMYALMHMMDMKARTTLTIDKDVIRKAKKLGINISQFCENALNDAIRRLEAPNWPYYNQNASKTAS